MPSLINLSLVFMNQSSSLMSRFLFSKRPHFGGNLNKRGNPDCEAENRACCLGRGTLSRTDRKVLRNSGTSQIDLLWADLRRTAEARSATGCIHKVCVSVSHQLQEICSDLLILALFSIKNSPVKLSLCLGCRHINHIASAWWRKVPGCKGKMLHSHSINHKNIT